MDRTEQVKAALEALQLSKEAKQHLYGTARYCGILAKRRQENEELALIAGLLHDVCFYLSGSALNHARRSAAWAEALLRALGCFEEAEIRAVHGAIYLHSDKDIVHGALAELLKDADVLEKQQRGIRLERLRRELQNGGEV